MQNTCFIFYFGKLSRYTGGIHTNTRLAAHEL